jgi:hypothetical protein
VDVGAVVDVEHLHGSRLVVGSPPGCPATGEVGPHGVEIDTFVAGARRSQTPSGPLAPAGLPGAGLPVRAGHGSPT